MKQQLTEIKRMQKLAGILKEDLESDIRQDLEKVSDEKNGLYKTNKTTPKQTAGDYNYGEKIIVDLEDLRSEYESTYLRYFYKGGDYMEFEEWLKKVKGINIK